MCVCLREIERHSTGSTYPLRRYMVSERVKIQPEKDSNLPGQIRRSSGPNLAISVSNGCHRQPFKTVKSRRSRRDERFDI